MKKFLSLSIIAFVMAIVPPLTHAQCNPNTTTGGTDCGAPVGTIPAAGKAQTYQLDVMPGTTAAPCMTLAQQPPRFPGMYRKCWQNGEEWIDYGAGYVQSGATGPTGPPGPQGVAGAQGPMGPQGPTGSVGPPGQPGATGPAGKQGAQGPQGIQGIPGKQGPPGKIQPTINCASLQTSKTGAVTLLGCH